MSWLLFWLALLALVIGFVLHLFHAPRSHVGRVLMVVGVLTMVIWILLFAACSAQAMVIGGMT